MYVRDFILLGQAAQNERTPRVEEREALAKQAKSFVAAGAAGTPAKSVTAAS